MHCKRAKLEIALWVGDDLDGNASDELKHHLSECAPCRQHRDRLKSSLKPLHDSDAASMFSINDSLWPNLLTQLPKRPADSEPSEFNGWLPALAVCAACLAIMTFWRANEFSRQSQPEFAGSSVSADTPPTLHRDEFQSGTTAVFSPSSPSSDFSVSEPILERQGQLSSRPRLPSWLFGVEFENDLHRESFSENSPVVPIISTSRKHYQ